jgi:phenylalanyl-tRNA synthetase alpha subunit
MIHNFKINIDDLTNRLLEFLKAQYNVISDNILDLKESIYRGNIIGNKRQEILNYLKIYELLLKGTRTTCWKNTWESSITKLLDSLAFTDFEITKAETVHTDRKIIPSFMRYIESKVPVIRRRLKLNPLESKDLHMILPKSLNFDYLNLKADIDADYSLQSTYWADTDHCLITHATPVLLSSKKQNILDYVKVYRRQNVDKTHLCEFHQLEYNKTYDLKSKIPPIKQLLRDFLEIFRGLGLTGRIHIRSTKYPYTSPSYEFYYSNSQGNLVEIGGCGIMKPEVMMRYSSNYGKIYLAGAIGLERVYALVHKLKNLAEITK